MCVCVCEKECMRKFLERKESFEKSPLCVFIVDGDEIDGTLKNKKGALN